jgi:hypothetical protein
LEEPHGDSEIVRLTAQQRFVMPPEFDPQLPGHRVIPQ